MRWKTSADSRASPASCQCFSASAYESRPERRVRRSRFTSPRKQIPPPQYGIELCPASYSASPWRMAVPNRRVARLAGAPLGRRTAPGRRWTGAPERAPHGPGQALEGHREPPVEAVAVVSVEELVRALAALHDDRPGVAG